MVEKDNGPNDLKTQYTMGAEVAAYNVTIALVIGGEPTSDSREPK